MPAMRIVSGPILLVAMASSLCFAQEPSSPKGAEYASPKRFEQEISAFAAQDRQEPPPPGAIVFIGSSSIRMWHNTIRQDLAPLTVIPRGFGGSTMNDAAHYAEQIVVAYRPRAVVIYEGDNDVAQGIRPELIRDAFGVFKAKVHARLPDARIYFLSIKPSMSRWKLWPTMQEANRLMAAQCALDDRLTYIDVASSLLDDSGQVKTDLFVADQLHLNAKGYAAWREVVRPILLKAESVFEKGDHQRAATGSP